MFFVGLDLGQKHDYTAVAIVERIDKYEPWQPYEFHSLHVRHAERVPLGTSYTDVVDRVREITRHREIRGQCVLIVDATGVGTPVIDMLRKADLGCEIRAVTITGGETESYASGRYSVPKIDLISGLQVLVERGELRIAGDLGAAAILLRELADLKSLGGRRVGAEGYGEHDDLAIALALACWRAKKLSVLNGTQRLFW